MSVWPFGPLCMVEKVRTVDGNWCAGDRTLASETFRDFGVATDFCHFGPSVCRSATGLVPKAPVPSLRGGLSRLRGVMMRAERSRRSRQRPAGIASELQKKLTTKPPFLQRHASTRRWFPDSSDERMEQGFAGKRRARERRARSTGGVGARAWRRGDVTGHYVTLCSSC